jgi:hypothetical protein
MEIEGESVAKPWRLWNGSSLVGEFATFEEAEGARQKNLAITGDITKERKRYKRGEMPGSFWTGKIS